MLKREISWDGFDDKHGNGYRVTKKSGVLMGDGARYSKERMFLTL